MNTLQRKWGDALHRINVCPILHPLVNIQYIVVCQCTGNYVKVGCGVFRYVTVSLVKMWGEPLLPMLSLLEEIDLLSLSGSCETTANHGVLLPFTGAARWQADDDSRVKPRCVCPLYAHESMFVCVSPAWRQKFVNGCRDCRHTWDSSRFQTTSDKTGRRERHIRERLSAKVIHSAISTGAVFHRIKPPLFRNTLLYSNDIWRIFRGSGDMQLWDADVQ